MSAKFPRGGANPFSAIRLKIIKSIEVTAFIKQVQAISKGTNSAAR